MTSLAPDAATISAGERERRAAALQRLLAEEGLDALVLAGADYRGHKGTLRWVGDYNLSHRYGFALVVPGSAPELLLPENLGMGRPAFYANRTVYSMLRVAALGKSNAALSIEQALTQFGTPYALTRFLGVPLRKVDQLLNTEARVV